MRVEKADVFSNDMRRCFVTVFAGVVLIGGVLTGCGGSSAGKSAGSSTPPPTVVAPSNLKYMSSSLSATVGVAITPDTNSISGSSATFTASPALPAGLMLDAATGTISGTPGSVASSANYAITAANSAGSTTQILTIAVAIASPANLTYAVPVVNDVLGTPMQPDGPTVTGTVAGYSIDPALPAGLALDPSTGVLSGTPVSASPATVYTVTAENSSGSAMAQLMISVNAKQAVLLEQGHGSPILTMRETAANVLSEDVSGHWVLWDYASGAIITSGDGAVSEDRNGNPALNQIDLAGQIAVVSTAQQLQMYSVADGHQILSVPAPSWWKLASDGSYLCAGTSTSLTAWSPSGEQVFSLSGDYHAGIAFAAPGQIQLAGGPSGANVIETDFFPGGKSTISGQFSGSFNSWFLDGSRFLSNLGNTVWVYSSAAVQQELVMLSSITNLTGQGNWFWSTPVSNYPPEVDIYAVGGTASPAQMFSFPLQTSYVASGNTIAALQSQTAALSVIDLSGSAPVRTDFSVPPIGNLNSFASASALQWIVGNYSGVLLDGASLASTRRYFGYGAVSSIVGSSNLAVVSTSTGKILTFNPMTAAQTESIDLFANRLSLSTDGTVLAAAGEDSEDSLPVDIALNLYALSSTAPSQSFSYTTPFLAGFSLSGSGTVLGQVLQSATSGSILYSRTVTNLQNGSTIFSDSGSNSPILLSPDGTLIASSVVSNPDDVSGYTTNIYRNGELISAAVGTGQGWLDNGHLLVATYTDDPKYGPYVSGFSIVDPTGAVLSSLTPEGFNAFNCPGNMLCVQLPTANWIYNPFTNSIYSVASGQLIWQVPFQALQNTGIGAVAGSQVVFTTGHRVVAVPGP
jgi:hypothetical protein